MMNMKLILGMAAALAVTSASALASVNAPDPYKKLRAVDLHPSNAPQLGGGINGLAIYETQYKENLPVQLNGAIDKVSRRKYEPRAKSIRF